MSVLIEFGQLSGYNAYNMSTDRAIPGHSAIIMWSVKATERFYGYKAARQYCEFVIRWSNLNKTVVTKSNEKEKQ